MDNLDKAVKSIIKIDTADLITNYITIWNILNVESEKNTETIKLLKEQEKKYSQNDIGIMVQLEMTLEIYINEYNYRRQN